jgi:CDP-glycerol glycerophosphotransferase (TagB/SpsB family)
VLFALTWRDWINPSTLPHTGYWTELAACADARWFAEALAPRGLKVRLFLHPLVREALLPRFEAMPEAPELVTRGGAVPEAVARAALVVTDYSSLAWDALYLGIPVVFFQFDLEEYLVHRASFVDLRSRLFGPTARTVSELESTLSSFVADDLRLPSYEADQTRWAKSAFAYTDDRNCERIVASIERVRSRQQLR